MSFKASCAVPHSSASPREVVSGDRDRPPPFPYLVLRSREWEWDLFHWKHVTLHAYFRLPFWVWEQNHCIQPCVRRQMGNVSFLFLTRKGPWQPWRELVRLVAVNQTRPEWKRLCFTQSSHGPRQLPKRPWADKALFLLATPLLVWDPSCSASEPVRVWGCVRIGKVGAGA